MCNTTDPHPSAARPKLILRWRVVDIVVASVVAVAGGVIFWAWAVRRTRSDPPRRCPACRSPGYGLWLFAGVLAALIVRKPGAALFAELVAAVVRVAGRQRSGACRSRSCPASSQGLGAEIVFALFLYASWRVWTRDARGRPGRASGGGILDLALLLRPASTAGFVAVYLTCFAISGAVLAGVLGSG